MGDQQRFCQNRRFGLPKASDNNINILKSQIIHYDKTINHQSNEIKNLQNQLHASERKVQSSQRELEEYKALASKLTRELKVAKTKEAQSRSITKISLLKVKELEEVINQQKDTIHSDREWAIFCTEEMESSERKFQDLECRKNAQIQSLSAENAKLQRAIEISKKNRDLLGMVNVEREPVNLKHGIKEDPTNFKADKRANHLNQISREIVSRKRSFVQTPSSVKTRDERNLQSQLLQKDSVSRLETIPSSIGSKEISDTSEPEVETIPFLEGDQIITLKRARFFRTQLHTLPDSEDNKVCAKCKGFDPPASSECEDYLVDWVGCECDRWFHIQCLSLSPEQINFFSCELVKQICRDGYITID